MLLLLLQCFVSRLVFYTALLGRVTAAAQIALFCVSAVAGGVMFYRWRRIGEEDRVRVWWLYGWFSALMACGSCVGAVAWAARMMRLATLYRGVASSNVAEMYSQFALTNSWLPAFLVLYAIEFLCMCAAKLMVLDRLFACATLHGTDIQSWWSQAGRVVMAVVVLGNIVGLAGNIASSVEYMKAAGAYSSASAYCAANSTDVSTIQEYLSLGLKEAQLGGSIASVQRFSEVTVLLLIVVAFVVVGVLSARRVSARLLGVDAASPAAATGRALRLQMLGITAFIFVTFLLRSALSTMAAVSQELRDFDKLCPDSDKSIYCDTCRNMYTHITGWMLFTPEFESTIVLISSPLALLVALWGMTSKATLQLMKSSMQKSAISLRLL